MHLRQLHHLAKRLVHKDAASVDRRTDRIGRDEQHTQAVWHALQGSEAIAEVAAERPPEGLRITDGGQGQSAAPRTESLRKLPEGPPQRTQVGAQGHVAEDHGQHGARPCEEKVRRQPPYLVNVLPAEENVVFLQYGLDLILREFLADGAAMLVEYHAAWLVVDLPAPLPRHETEVRVLQVEGFQQTVEAAEFEEFGAVESAAAAAAVEAGVEIVDCAIDAVANSQAAVLPPALREAGLLADLGCIGEEDLARHGEDFGIAEAF